MARPLRSLLPDGVYHVTTRGVARRPIYRGDDDRRFFLAVLLAVTRAWRWRCHAFCLMGNHYHLVVESTREALSRGMHRLNGHYAEEFNAKYARTGHLFGDRFVTRLIEEDEYLEDACRYVLFNPVRAGLCAGPAEWP